MASLLKCREKKTDCFGNNGSNRCMVVCKKVEGKCPFYQTKEQVEAGRQKAHRRLVDLGRDDLIEKFEHNSLRRW